MASHVKVAIGTRYDFLRTSTLHMCSLLSTTCKSDNAVCYTSALQPKFTEAEKIAYTFFCYNHGN